MTNIHMTLQGKGGVGKSFVASLVMQYLLENKIDVKGIDTDPINQTFASYKNFNVKHLKLLEDSDIIPRNFDLLMEELLNSNCQYVIDNGASTFLPLASYLKENEAFSLLATAKKNVIIHTIITGGQALKDTLSGLFSLCTQIPPTASIVVWKNEFFGYIIYEGKNFEEMKVFKENKERISAIVTIPRQTSTTFGEDIKTMLDKRLTFNEITNSNEFSIMAKSRLARVKSMLFNQIDNIPGI
ncbi:conjugal transfer protein TraL [Bartonella krasnovii]|uniref:Conjugal transfer protein TraL n=1 Tax=Bartonella krasnovii TaxID=2267275 RepID=A0A5B9RWF0_9HYPH|nr:conjugal transfer protein TraL [Bartonella krasnovii]QEG79327.1 conjugal transfer protein TraL [Bartonella krasnovii]